MGCHSSAGAAVNAEGQCLTAGRLFLTAQHTAHSTQQEWLQAHVALYPHPVVCPNCAATEELRAKNSTAFIASSKPASSSFPGSRSFHSCPAEAS